MLEIVLKLLLFYICVYIFLRRLFEAFLNQIYLLPKNDNTSSTEVNTIFVQTFCGTTGSPSLD